MVYHNKQTLLVSSLMCIFLFSCEQVKKEKLEENNHTIATRSIYKSEKGDYEVTQQMAELFVKSNKENLPVIDVIPYKMDGITCFYIFNFEKGFKVISADTRIQPILAESEEDQLNPYESNNQGVKVWLEDTADRIRILKTHNPDTGENYSELWSEYNIPNEHLYNRDEEPDTEDQEDSIWVFFYETTIENVYNNYNIGPLLETKWGQGSPWNSKMPKIGLLPCLTGCAAVAVSQVLYYYNQETSYPNDFWHTINIQSLSICPVHNGIIISLNKSDYTNNSSRWSQMPIDKYGNNTDYASYLMLDVGARLGMHYSLNESGVLANSDYSIPHLSSCGISCTISPYLQVNVDNSIIQRKPVIVSASLYSNGSGGHAWVIDGSRNLCNRYTTYKTYYCIHRDDLSNYLHCAGTISYEEMRTLYPDVEGGVYSVIHSVRYDYQESLHMNWGYDGNCDSWYNMLNSANWIYTDTSGNSDNFLYNRVIHYDISTSQIN